MSYSETKGDLFEYVGNNPEEILWIPHIVNSLNAFGAGFVVPLAKYYPDAKKRYHDYPEFRVLGKTLYIPCVNHNGQDDSRNVIIANMCAQTLGGKRPLYYNALAKCMIQIANDIIQNYNDKFYPTIVCPKFGSALAGGNWEFIRELIHDCWVREGLTVKVFYL